MPRVNARFRISIKDKVTGRAVKIELIDAPGMWGERRYKIRVDGREATRVKEATLSEIFDRLRRWVVQRAETTAGKNVSRAS
jgi:hypothetical protein